MTDPMGLQGDTQLISGPNHGNSVIEMNDRAYNFIMGLMQRQFSSAISAGMAGYQFSSLLSTVHFDTQVTQVVNKVDVLRTRSGAEYRKSGSYGGTEPIISPGDPEYSGTNSTSVHLTVKTQLLKTNDARLAQNAERIECRNRNYFKTYFFGEARTYAQLHAAEYGIRGIYQYVQMLMNDYAGELRKNDWSGRNNPLRDQEPCNDNGH